MTTAVSMEPDQGDLRVIDTEGTPILREVAVLNGHGQLLYEARTPDEDGEYYAADLVRPLQDLMRDLRQLLQGHRVVAHNAAHDSGVLAASFEACGLQPPSLEWHCTLELAQRLHPGAASHALGPLCDALELGSEPFCRDAAHQAAYDARFTYLLYRHLQRDEHSRRLADAANPFSSARVDTPFQRFVDDRRVHQAAFTRLSAVLRSIAGDNNKQSQGAVLVGEPGSGKTHLVMRLANEVLRNNRLLFVRQPTQAGTVLFHIYSRTLESLVEPVGDGRHSQLDLLLIRALRWIMRDAVADPEIRESAIDREILAALEAEDLVRLGRDGTEAKRNRWERLETRMLRWWADQHSAAGTGRQMLQGLLRFCRYTDEKRRESLRRWLTTGECEPVDKELEGLSPWNDQQLREEFSLQALRVIGLLCSLDAPLILVFDQLEGLWQEGNRELLLRFGDVIRELFTHMPYALVLVTLFPDRWQRFQSDFEDSVTDRVGQHVIHLEAPRAEEIEEILDLRLAPLDVKAVELFSSDDLEKIVRLPSLRRCLNRAAAVFEHRVRGVPLPPLPPPPPPPLSAAGSGVQVNQRLLTLEQQLAELIERLEGVEGRLDGLEGRLQGAGLRPEPEQSPKPQPGPTPQPTTTASPEAPPPQERQAQPDRSPARAPAPTAPGGRITVEDDVELNPYEDLFRRYRQTTLETLQQRWEKPQIIDDSDDAGKLRQIAIGYQQIRRLEVDSLRLGTKRVPDNVVIRIQKSQWCVAFLHATNANSVNSRLTNLNQLVMNHRQVQFFLMRDVTAPPITSKGAAAAYKAFVNGCGDGVQRTHDRPLTQERRIALEFVNQLISDIVNQELDLPLADGLALLARYEPDNWVVQLLHPQRRR